MYVEFVSSPAGPLLNTGFHFNVGNWPGHVDTPGVKSGACDWLLTSEALKSTSANEGIFLSIAHWYPPNTTCNYHIQGAANEMVRLYFPTFRVNRIEAAIEEYPRDCGESLTIYDSDHADPARIIKTFCDTFSKPLEKVDFVSTGRSLFVRFDSRTGSYSGSSLYYWAHYDFFNNTKYGEPVPNTLCDEVMYPWKSFSGNITSPVNTLVYKRTIDSELRCQYRFAIDKRIFSRVLIDVTAIAFKELPFTTTTCTRCHEEQIDKLIIWERKPPPVGIATRLACFCDNIPRPVRVFSSSDQLNVEMIVQGKQAAANYFKGKSSLFTATYEFAHGPICGEMTLGPSGDGELVFPHRHTLGTTPKVRRIEKCIWELKVSPQRDLWLHLDKARFADKSCDQGRLEIYLAGRLEPRFIICPQNVSLAKDLTILSAAELGAFDSDNEPLPVLIQYSGDNMPGRNAFRLVWTELLHIPRKQDGTIVSAMLQSAECFFRCPGDQSICIPQHLVCNGIINCPNVTADLNRDYIDDNLNRLGIHDAAVRAVTYLHDELPEMCEKKDLEEMPYVKIVLMGCGAIVLIAIFLAILCRSCRRKEFGDDED